MRKIPLLSPVLALIITPALVEAQEISNPYPDIISSGVEVNYREFATLPKSSSTKPYARINHLKPVADEIPLMGVNDLNGPMYLVDYDGNSHLYFDLRATHASTFANSPGLGTGFTSFAFHPEFATNGKFYTSHMEKPNSGTPNLTLPVPISEQFQGVIIEWTANDPFAKSFSGTRRELMRIDFPGSIHGLQEIAFRRGISTDHPDYGLLFICIGEGQTLQKGPLANTGNKKSPLGTIVRIDPFGNNSNNGEYGIPSDNPFVGDSEALPEIFAYGFRNPHRITWDNENNHLLLAEIGEKQVEELNIVIPGGHYGWPVREGKYRLDPNGTTNVVYPLPEGDSGFVYPVAAHDHDDGFAIAGGFIYRGSRHSGLVDQYLAGDVRSGRLWLTEASTLTLGEEQAFKEWFVVNNQSSRVDFVSLQGTNRADLRIGTDHFGEIYVMTKQDGKIRKLINAEEPDGGYGQLEGFAWDNHYIDTQSHLGLVEVTHYPWIYSFSLKQYIYANPEGSTDTSWYFIPQ